MARPEQPRRRPGRLIAWLLGLHAGGLLLLLLLAAPFILVRFHGVRTWLLDQSLHRSVLDDRTYLEIDRILRFDPAGISLRGVRLMSGQGSHGRPWASLEALDVRWAPLELLRRRLRAQSIRMDSLTLYVDVPPPGLRKEGRGSDLARRADPRLPPLELERFALDDIILRDSTGVILRASIAMDGLRHRDRRISASIERGVASLETDTLELAFEGGRIEGELLTYLTLEGLTVRAPGLAATVGGEVRFPREADRGPVVRSVVDVQRVAPAENPFLRRLDLPIEDGDSFSGSVQAGFNDGMVDFQTGLSGRFRGGDLDTLVVLGRRDGDTLDLDRFEVRHRAGIVEGQGRLRIGGRQLEGRISFVGLDPGDSSVTGTAGKIPHMRLDGSAEGSATLLGEPRAEAACALTSVRFQGREFDPLYIAGRLDEGLLILDSLRYGVGGVTARGVYELETKRIEASARLRGLAGGAIVEPLLSIPFGGEFDGDLDVSGHAESPRVLGWLAASDFHVVEVHASRVRVDSLRATFTPLNLSGDVSAESIRAYKIPMDSARVNVRWTDRMRVSALVFKDTLRVEATVSVTPAEPGSLAVESLTVRPGSLRPWRAQPDAVIRWKAGSAQIRDVELRSDSSVVRGWLDVARGGSALRGDFVLEAFDLLNVRRFFALPDSILAGSVSAHGSIGGTAVDPSIDLELDGRDLVVAQWPVGDLMASIRSRQRGSLTVDTLFAGKGGGWGRLRASGVRAHVPGSVLGFIEAAGDSLPSLLERTKIDGRLGIEDLSLARIVRVGLAASPADASAWLEMPSDPMASRIRTVRQSEQGVESTRTTDLDGRIQLGVSIGGTPQAPRIAATGGIDDLRAYQARADSVRFGVSYAPGSLTLDSLVWHRDPEIARGVGRLPLVVRAVPGEARLIDSEPIALDAELPEIDLSVLGILSQQIQDPSGILSGSISLRGTPAKMWPEGNLRVRNGAIRIPRREERLREIEGEIRLDSAGVHVPSLTARSGKDGRITASGSYKNPKDYEFVASAENVTFYETGLYHATADGEVTMFPVVTQASTYPLIVGTATVKEGAIIGDLAKQQPPPDTGGKRSPIRAEIDVEAPGNLRLSTPVATVELGQGEDLHVSFEDPYLNISGRLTVISGRYRVFNNVFRITGGTVEFRDTGRGPEPILNIDAQTEVPDPTDPSKPETITVHAEGPVLALDFEFSSTKGRSEPEIVELLSLGRFTDAGGQFGVEDPSRQYLFTEMVSQLEAQMSRIFQPLSNLEVQTGFGPSEQWRVNYRQSVMPQLALAYSREISSRAAEEVKLHYNLQGMLYLTAGLERHARAGNPLVDRYSLDLKMRFEYK